MTFCMHWPWRSGSGNQADLQCVVHSPPRCLCIHLPLLSLSAIHMIKREPVGGEHLQIRKHAYMKPTALCSGGIAMRLPNSQDTISPCDDSCHSQAICLATLVPYMWSCRWESQVGTHVHFKFMTQFLQMLALDIQAAPRHPQTVPVLQNACASATHPLLIAAQPSRPDSDEAQMLLSDRLPYQAIVHGHAIGCQ